MKQKILKSIEKYLQGLARRKIAKAKPKIVAITGSYGKTSAKEAIFSVLNDKFGSDVGKNWGNMNSTLGLPLAILGLKKYSFGFGLLYDIIRATWNAWFYRLPRILVLEFGIDKPGEMDTLTSFVTPDIAVITGISETHLEELGDVEGVRRQKNLLFNALPPDGVAILNAGDKNSEELAVNKGVNKITFGSTDADVYADNINVAVDGTIFDLKYFGKKEPVKSKLIGAHVINNLLIAAAVAGEFKINIGDIKASLEKIKPENGRMNPIKIGELTVIDDSYNSNPKSAEESLVTLSTIKTGGRKIAVLGNMNELGNYEKEGHLRIGKAAAKAVDLLIAVGDNAEVISSGAKLAGLSEEKILAFKSTDDLIQKIDELIKKGDLVLVKGSQNRVRLEKLIKYLLKNDELAEKILVRQEKKWQGK